MKTLPQEAKRQDKKERRAKLLRAAKLFAILLIVCGVRSYFLWQSGPITAPDAQTLSERIGNRHKKQVERQHRVWQRENILYTTSAAHQQRQQLRLTMLQTASATEVDGVLTTFDKTVAGKIGFKPYGNLAERPTYFWPLYAEKGYIDNVDWQSVWVIECGWESLELLRDVSHKYPGHMWRLVIDAAPPHRVQYSENCS